VNTIKNETLVPQGGGFVYVDPDTLLRDPEKATFKHCRVDILMGIAKNHRKINNYPIGAHWNQEFIDNVCANTLGDVCTSDEPPSLLQRAKTLASAIGDAARDGFRTRSAEEVQKITEICQGCQYYGGAKGLLGVACLKCGCFKIKFHIQSSHCPIDKW